MSINFVGVVDEDGECFCWRDVQRGDKVAIIGQDNYDSDRRLEEEFRKDEAQDRQVEYDSEKVERAMEMLYPGDVMVALGVKDGKRYRFTVAAEEI